MEHMTAAEYQALLNKKQNKMRSQKTVIDGIKFDSKLEADYYCQLKILVRTGEVKSFTLQPKYLLQEKFCKDGKTIRKMEYIADFLVTYANGREEIIDCKGHKTRVYLNKKKLFEKLYPHLSIKEVN